MSCSPALLRYRALGFRALTLAWTLLLLLCGFGTALATSRQATVIFGARNYRVDEAQATLPIELGVSASCDATIRGSVIVRVESGSAAPAVDYVATLFPLSHVIDRSDVRSFVTGLSIPGLIINDRAPEGLESFDLVLTSSSLTARCGETSLAVVVDDRATVWINDDDSEESVPFDLPIVSISGVTHDEGDEGEQIFSFEVVMTGSSETTVLVEAETASQSATPGADYQQHLATLAFPPGESLPQLFTVTVFGDLEVERDEAFLVRLRPPAAGSARLGISEAAGVIVNDDVDAREIVAVSGDSQRGGLGGKLARPLVVELRDEAGSPLARQPMNWQIESGSATFKNRQREITVPTGTAGRSSVELFLGPQPGPVRVVASFRQLSIAFNVNADVVALDPKTLTENQAAVASSINDLCGSPELDDSDLIGVCDDLASLAGDELRETLRQMSGDDVVAQGDLLRTATGAQLFNIGTRLAALRRGQVSALGQLAVVIDGDSVPVSALARRATWSQRGESGGAHTTAKATGGAGDEESDDVQAPGERLGLFVAGTVGYGRRDATAREEGFDLESSGLTVGVDYRLGEGVYAGVALGLLNADNELHREGGALEAKGLFALAYSTKSWELCGERVSNCPSAYLEGTLSYGRSDFEVLRNIDFSGRPRASAQGETAGSQLGLMIGAGYSYPMGASLITGFLRSAYNDFSIDGYTEVGAPGLNLIVGEQQLSSFTAELGLQFDHAFSIGAGVLRPDFRLSLIQQLDDESRVIDTRLVGTPAGSIGIPILTDDPDRSYGNFGLGLVYVAPRQQQFSLFYGRDFANEDLDYWRIQLGARFGF